MDNLHSLAAFGEAIAAKSSRGNLRRSSWASSVARAQGNGRVAVIFPSPSNNTRMLADRLYVLRNQLVRGGAEILGFLTPVFVDIMMDNPAECWGRSFCPVVE